MSKQTVITK